MAGLFRDFTRITLPLAGMHLLTQGSRSIMAVVGPVLAVEFAFSAGDLGLLSAALFASYALVQLPLGLALDLYGPRRVQFALALVAAAGFGVLRAHTVRIYRALDGTAMRAGGAATVLAWLASLGAHLLLDKAIDASAGVGSLGLSTIYLYLGITLMIQNWRIRASARRLAAQPPAGDPAVAGRL